MALGDTTVVVVRDANGTLQNVDNVEGPGGSKQQRVHVRGFSEGAGTYAYRAGAAGTPTFPALARIRSITCYSATGAAGTVTINGGDTIPVPTGVGLNIILDGQLVAPVIVFTLTDSYFVDFVT